MLQIDCNESIEKAVESSLKNVKTSEGFRFIHVHGKKYERVIVWGDASGKTKTTDYYKRVID
jgi:hypothetical protein